MKRILKLAAAAIICAVPHIAHAALVDFQSYSGNVAVSTDGYGDNSNGGNGIIRASAPSGSNVVAAYLYTATHNTTAVPTAISLDGNSISYNQTNPNNTACCSLASHRTDVTSLVKPVIDGGSGGVYDFNISEGADNFNTDGHALVVVYSNPALPQASVGLLDGFASVTGDSTAINFTNPFDPLSPGFFAEMSLGISFSCCDASTVPLQSSLVDVNGMRLTDNAGGLDDGLEAADGSLITVGSFDDAFSPANPSYAEDTERYDLSSFVSQGDTSIMVDTFNASQDDNIFLASFYVSGLAGFNAPPPTVPTVPTTPTPPITPTPMLPTAPHVIPVPIPAVLLLTGLIGLGAIGRRKQLA